MTEEEMEEKIRSIMEEEYKAKYIGKLKVEKTPNFTTLKIGLRNMEYPQTYGADLDDEEFLKYIRKVIREAGFNRAKYFTGYRWNPLYEERPY